MKKKLNKQLYRFMHRELKNNVNRGIINDSQVDDMMTFYEEGYGLSFIRVIATVGAVLIGLGFILFIANHWDAMGRIVKVLIILAGIGGALFTSYKLEKNYPKTSEAFLYLATIIFGAGIFLIEQIFNINDPRMFAVLIWTTGSLGMALLYKKTLLFVFAQFLGLVYVTSTFDNFVLIEGLLIVAAYYYVNSHFKFSKLNTLLSNAIALILVLNVLFYFNVDGFINAIVFLVIGLGLYYIEHNLNRDIFKFTGLVAIGAGGFALSFKYLWEQVWFIDNGNVYSLVFGILFVVYLLSLVEKRQIVPLIFTCVMIFRYYFDQLYDFLPKSMFFIIGGAMLLAFGFYIERYRSGGIENEKHS